MRAKMGLFVAFLLVIALIAGAITGLVIVGQQLLGFQTASVVSLPSPAPTYPPTLPASVLFATQTPFTVPLNTPEVALSNTQNSLLGVRWEVQGTLNLPADGNSTVTLLLYADDPALNGVRVSLLLYGGGEISPTEGLLNTESPLTITYTADVFGGEKEIQASIRDGEIVQTSTISLSLTREPLTLEGIYTVDRTQKTLTVTLTLPPETQGTYDVQLLLNQASGVFVNETTQGRLEKKISALSPAVVTIAPQIDANLLLQASIVGRDEVPTLTLPLFWLDQPAGILLLNAVSSEPYYWQTGTLETLCANIINASGALMIPPSLTFSYERVLGGENEASLLFGTTQLAEKTRLHQVNVGTLPSFWQWGGTSCVSFTPQVPSGGVYQVRLSAGAENVADVGIALIYQQIRRLTVLSDPSAPKPTMDVWLSDGTTERLTLNRSVNTYKIDEERAIVPVWVTTDKDGNGLLHLTPETPALPFASLTSTLQIAYIPKDKLGNMIQTKTLNETTATLVFLLVKG